MTPALIQLADILRDLGDLSPTLDSVRCLNVRHRRAGQCVACQAACPLGAIQSQPVPAIDSSRCLGCNACAAACPVSALQGRLTPLETWRRTVSSARDGVTSVVCRAAGGGQSAATPIPCVSAMPAEFYIGLSSAGIRHLTLYTADCEDCPLCASLDQARSAIQVTQVFLGPFGLGLELEQVIGRPPQTEIKSTGVSRRQFLRGLVHPASTLAPVQADRLDDLVTNGYGWRRALLLDALQRLGDVPAVRLPSQTGYWGGLVVDSTCIGCVMCAHFCPTEALRVAESDDGQVMLWFDVSRCTACGLCQRVCFKGAIACSDGVDLRAMVSRQPVSLWQGSPPANPLSKRLNTTRSPP